MSGQHNQMVSLPRDDVLRGSCVWFRRVPPPPISILYLVKLFVDSFFLFIFFVLLKLFIVDFFPSNARVRERSTISSKVRKKVFSIPINSVFIFFKSKFVWNLFDVRSVHTEIESEGWYREIHISFSTASFLYPVLKKTLLVLFVHEKRRIFSSQQKQNPREIWYGKRPLFLLLSFCSPSRFFQVETVVPFACFCFCNSHFLT